MYAILEPKLGRDMTRLIGQYNLPDKDEKEAYHKHRTLINGVKLPFPYFRYENKYTIGYQLEIYRDWMDRRKGLFFEEIDNYVGCYEPWLQWGNIRYIDKALLKNKIDLIIERAKAIKVVEDSLNNPGEYGVRIDDKGSCWSFHRYDGRDYNYKLGKSWTNRSPVIMTHLYEQGHIPLDPP